jgi:hypothetical protein
VALLALAGAACTVATYEPPPPVVIRPAPPAPTPPPPGGGVPDTPPAEPPPPPPPEEPIPPPPVTPPPSRSATNALLQQGRQQAATGNYPLATATLERAVRINPRDAELWLELGRVKLRQGDRVQAQNMGRRALSLSGSNASLRARCQALISAAGG